MNERHIRAFTSTIERRADEGGARVLSGLLVPYDVVADVLDWLDNGQPDIYQEGFRRSAFEGQVSPGPLAWKKINLVHRHEGGLGFLGPGILLRSESDGLYGDFRILRTKASDVEDLLDAGVNELS